MIVETKLMPTPSLFWHGPFQNYSRPALTISSDRGHGGGLRRPDIGPSSKIPVGHRTVPKYADVKAGFREEVPHSLPEMAACPLFYPARCAILAASVAFRNG
jgi:hypothetical protein